MKLSSKQTVKFIVGLGISALAIWYLSGLVSWQEFNRALKIIPPHAPILIVLSYLTGFILRGVRSKLLFAKLTWFQSTATVLLGYAGNNVLPARMGEVLRGVITARLCGDTKTHVISIVFVERVFDGLSVVLLLGLASSFFELNGVIRGVVLGGLGLFVGVFFALVVLGLIGEKLVSVAKLRLRQPRIERFLQSLVYGIRHAMLKPIAIVVFLLSLGTWFIEGCVYLLTFKYFGLTDLGLLAALVCMGVANLAVLIPSSPGGLGVFHWGLTQAMLALGVAQSRAIPVTVVLHACQIVPTTILGFLLLKPLGFKNMKEVSEQIEQSETAETLVASVKEGTVRECIPGTNEMEEQGKGKISETNPSDASQKTELEQIRHRNNPDKFDEIRIG